MGTTHMLVGGTSALVACHLGDVNNAAAVALVGTAVFGSLLPDADDRNSRIYHPTETERRHAALFMIGGLVRLVLSPLTLLPHRGPTHWPGTAVAVTAACAAWIAAFVAAGMGVGYGLHLAADGCTKDGIPLWPGRKVWLLPAGLRIRTGKKAESLLVFIWIMGSIAVLIAMSGRGNG